MNLNTIWLAAESTLGGEHSQHYPLLQHKQLAMECISLYAISVVNTPVFATNVDLGAVPNACDVGIGYQTWVHRTSTCH